MGVLLVGVLTIGALLSGVHDNRTSDFWKLPHKLQGSKVRA